MNKIVSNKTLQTIFYFFGLLHNKVLLNGCILESPFLNMAHATTEYLVSPIFYNNPWIRSVGKNALEELNLYFNTDKQYNQDYNTPLS